MINYATWKYTPFTYLVPENLNEQLAVGMRVEVPFGNGNRHVQGFVLA
ncbi:primosomal protein N' family DNA-binding protein, partial [Enterococcus faecalis]